MLPLEHLGGAGNPQVPFPPIITTEGTMARKSPQAATDKWQRRVAMAGQDYAAGIQNATGWAQNSQAAAGRRNAGLQQAIANGTIDAGIQRTGDAGWKTKTVAKGPANWTAGVAKAQAAMLSGQQRLAGYLAAADAAVANMPRDTVDQRTARAQAYQLAVHRAAQAAKSGH